LSDSANVAQSGELDRRSGDHGHAPSLDIGHGFFFWVEMPNPNVERLFLPVVAGARLAWLIALATFIVTLASSRSAQK
jgi:hypothetical protein